MGPPTFPIPPSFVARCCIGAVGPLLNHPVDVVKTRLFLSNGMSPMDIVLRIVPGHGITFLVYDDTLKSYTKKNYFPVFIERNAV